VAWGGGENTKGGGGEQKASDREGMKEKKRQIKGPGKKKKTKKGVNRKPFKAGSNRDNRKPV